MILTRATCLKALALAFALTSFTVNAAIAQEKPAADSVQTANVPKPVAPFPYVWGTAYHIDPSTTTDESGYFSLNEGTDGTIYVGTAAYGRNAYLVAFDPKNNFKQTTVVDAHKVAGLPLTPTGYAAQAKFHTRNFTGPSGKVYIGTKQGYATEEDKKKDRKSVV